VLVFAGALALAAPSAVLADPPAVPAQAGPVPTGPALALVPYEQSIATKDPYAKEITEFFAQQLTNRGVAVTIVPTVPHLEAVAHAAEICAANQVSGLLIAEGRYEQTVKNVDLFVVASVHFPTHVEFRLDEVGCDGVVQWSTTTMADELPSDHRHLNSYTDDAFRTAEIRAAVAFTDSTIPPVPPRELPAALASPAPLPTPTAYLLLPLAQPSIDDPHIGDATNALFLQMQQRKLAVTLGAPRDHLTVIAEAPALCAAARADAIVVPDVRIEQSSVTARSHASLHLTLVDCFGRILAHADADADIGDGSIHNFGAAVTAVAERAMEPALNQLFPATAVTTAATK
jgi:hypothetical protein